MFLFLGSVFGFWEVFVPMGHRSPVHNNVIENAERNTGNHHHYRWPLSFFTYMYEVSSLVHWFSFVKTKIFDLCCISLHTLRYPCIPLPTFGHSWQPLNTLVYPCTPLYTLIDPCMPLYTLALYTLVYPSKPVSLKSQHHATNRINLMRCLFDLKGDMHIFQIVLRVS